MAFRFAPMTRLAMTRLGLTEESIASLERLEDIERRAARASRSVSVATLLRRQAKAVEKAQRKQKQRGRMVAL